MRLASIARAGTFAEHPRFLTVIERGPLMAVHSSRHKCPGGFVNQDPTLSGGKPRQSVGGGEFIQKRQYWRSPLLKTTALRENGLLAAPS